MTEKQHPSKRPEAGTPPASLFSAIVLPRKETHMNKLAYFLIGVLTGAVALGVAAFVVDEHAGSSSSDESDTDEEETDETESSTDATSPSGTVEPENQAQA